MAQVVKNLEQVYDPEMPSISVIHLGLIYDIEVIENNTVVKITHTLTSAFCPMADEINQEIQNIFESNPLIEKEDACEDFQEDNCTEHYLHYDKDFSHINKSV